jgi:probable phosphoglycerate mutase
MADIVLIRHGQTEWSRSGQHTSYTDIGLTPDGERQARELGARLAGRTFAAVLSSPRRRAQDTAALAGLPITHTTDDLAEWHYGEYEGITTATIRQTRPGWYLWTDGCPGGETADQVGARLDRVLEQAVEAGRDGGDVALIGHGHALRVAGARWIGLPVADGGRLRLDTATLSVLGHEHDRRVILRWNT